MKSPASGIREKITAVAVFLSFLGMITVNALANVLPLNGVNTGTLSDEIPNLFVPAGFTFSIWGVIYLLLLGFSAAVLYYAFSGKGKDVWNADDSLIFIANAFFNGAWIFAWHWRLIPLSLALMCGILATLAFLLEKRWKRFKETGKNAPFLLTVPLSVYLGWICVATIANVTALLVTSGWNAFGLSESFWAIAMILAGLAVGLVLLFMRNEIPAALVVVWAYAGIAAKRLPLGEGNGVAVAAIGAAAILLAAVAGKAAKSASPRRT